MIQLKAHTMKNISTKKLNKRQELILEHIMNENGAFSIADIFAFVKKEEEDVSRITVVRDMGLLTDEGLLSREGAGRAVRYRISAQYNLLKEVAVQKYFEVPQDDRKIQKQFNHGIFTLLSKNVFTENEQKRLLSLHAEFRKHLRNIGSATIIKKEFERVMIEFSWKSSQIEGNTYSLLDTEALIKNKIKAKGKTEKETQMILNHKKAFNFVMENRNKFAILSRAKIERLHSLLVENLHVTPNLRKSPVGITGTNYRPLDNQSQIAEALSEMIDLINIKKDFFEKSFLSLVLLSYIQAFEDGNKRTARLTSNALLLAYDSAPISYRAVSEVEYKKANILFYEQNNLSYFKHVFISQYEFAVRNYFNV